MYLSGTIHLHLVLIQPIGQPKVTTHDGFLKKTWITSLWADFFHQIKMATADRKKGIFTSRFPKTL
jgi:hypothetical protein